MKNRVKSIVILIILIIIFYAFGIYGVNANCIFKSITNIECPACGLTRAFRSIIKLDFITAIKYNILSIPIAILVVVSAILLIYDIITRER